MAPADQRRSGESWGPTTDGTAPGVRPLRSTARKGLLRALPHACVIVVVAYPSGQWRRRPLLRFCMGEIMDLFDLSGKTAVVTGGSRGIGLMIARGLLEAGAR